MALLWQVNPKGKKRRSKKHRSAAQKRATKRMLAARWGRNPRHHKKHRKSHHKTRRRTTHRKHFRRNPRRILRAFSGGGMVGLLKDGLLGGVGAVGVDILMGYTAKVLPASFATPVDASGGVNFGYFGVKTGLALLLGTQGRRVMPGAIARKMADGALTVMAYQFIRPMVPSAISLGYLNPAPTMRPVRQVAGAGKYVSGLGKVLELPMRANSAASDNAGSRAAAVLRLANANK